MDGRKCFYFSCVLCSAISIRGSGAAVRPVVTFTPNWSELLYQDPVTITCDVGSAAPENQGYHWYKDGKPMTDKHQQSLKIDFVREKHLGDYQCGTNTSDLSPPVTLKASAGYLILQRPPLIYEGDHLTLRCHTVYGFHGMNTTFYKEDKEIKFSVHDSELHIDTVDGGASGTYKCTQWILHSDDHQYHYYSSETHISVLGDPSEDESNLKIITGAAVGIVVLVLIFLLILFWKCRNKIKSLSTCQEPQATNASMAADTLPDLEEDICYADLRMEHLQPASSTTARESVDVSATYAVVKHRHH